MTWLRVLLVCLAGIYVVHGYSKIYLSRQSRSNAFSRGLALCYGTTKDNYYPLQNFSGVTIVHYDAVLDVTMVLEFCYSISLVKGLYDTTTERVVQIGDADKPSSHSFGYYLNTIGDATNGHELLQQYQQGDKGWPCSMVQGGFYRNATVAINCGNSGFTTCADGSTCIEEGWGGCVCQLTQKNKCYYEVELLMNCEPREGFAKFTVIYMMKFGGFGIIMLLVTFMVRVENKRQNRRDKDRGLS